MDDLTALLSQLSSQTSQSQPQQEEQSKQTDDPLSDLLAKAQQIQPQQASLPEPHPQLSSQGNTVENSLNDLLSSLTTPQPTPSAVPPELIQSFNSPVVQNSFQSQPSDQVSIHTESQNSQPDYSDIQSLLGSLQSSIANQPTMSTQSTQLKSHSPLMNLLNNQEASNKNSGEEQKSSISENPSINGQSSSTSTPSAGPMKRQSSLSLFLNKQKRNRTPSNRSTTQSQPTSEIGNKAEKLEILKMTEKQIPPYKQSPSMQINDKKTFDKSNTITNFICNMCPEGTIIEIPAGEYECTLHIRQSVHLKGIGGKVVFKKTQEAAPVITSACSMLILEGIDIIQETLDNAISVLEGCTQLINCTISVNKHSAIRLYGKSIAEAEGCHFSRGYNPTVFLDDNSTMYLKNTTVSDSEMAGVYVDNSATCYIDEGCKFNQMANIGVVIQNKGQCLINKAEFHQAKYAAIDCSTSFDTTMVTNCKFHNCAQGIVSDKASFITVKNCQFERCDYSSLHAQDKGRILSIGNTFKDALGNMIVLANSYGVIQSENDSLTGSCNSAYCAYQDGYIQCNKAQINNVVNTSALCYDQGSIRITNSKFTNTQQVGIRLTDFSRCYIENTELSNSNGSGISTNNSVSLYAKNVTITGMHQKAIDIADVKKGMVSISHCDIYKNDGGFLIQGECRNENCIISECNIHENLKTGLEVCGEKACPLITKCKIIGNLYAGADFTLQCQPLVRDCQFCGNKESGIQLEGGSPLIENCDISQSAQGFIASNGSKATLQNCQIHENSNRGGQLQNQDTCIEAQQCHFYKHLNGIDLLAVENGSINCTDCIFETSLKHHVNAMDGGYICLTNCDLSKSNNGEGIRALADGVIELIDSKVHDQSKLCVLISDRGIFKARNSIFTENANCGVYIEKGGSGEFVGCTVSSNGQYGFDVHGGMLTIKDCTVKDHYAYGIFLDKGSVFNETNTTHSNNRKANVYHFT